MTADCKMFVGAVAAAASVLTNAERPRDICLHFIVPAVDAPSFRDLARAHLSDLVPGSLSVVPWTPPHWLKHNIRVTGNKAQLLNSTLNFARFLLPALLPGVDRVVFLDADTICLVDINTIFRLLGDGLIAAVHHLDPDINGTFTPHGHAALAADHGVVVNSTFNPGVFVASLDKWRATNIELQVEKWMRLHATSEHPLWYSGSQAVSIVVFAGRSVNLEWLWNLWDLGWAHAWTFDATGAKILHWSGYNKPWTEFAEFRDVWTPYAPSRGAVLEHSRRLNTVGNFLSAYTEVLT
eukprot:CAMPEP_0175891062 /NCGR_PEP_ID=MMETSP0107_2-20121207/48180_1 /TAXON_ID=195067 ORGANISM="Goniomonas pacifica, Strain CCMP1869" /NCGR_SAMPLE_ID=MMETSP0107_2 /ASSEMBLY_ACC=CAM_ASM_000203 /LENGTH=294 /DNA_ID=CAMNT_0017211907 /DNA_START=246 /DNA_END=1131 /DNA_ORIENTATION=-